MLLELSINNFALIDELMLSFSPGLNLITGETGAGKSILIDALGLALGERSTGQDAIRSGADRCLVEAVFNLSDAPAATLAYLSEQGLLSDDDEDSPTLLISRELTRSGKNQCRINGRLMPVAALREATDGLVDVHGQHEHQTLLATDRHIELLDSWLGTDALGLREEVSRHFSAAGAIRRELHELRESARDRARNLDLYRFQANEITAASLSTGEEEELAAERTRLMSAEKLRALAEDAYSALNDMALDGLNSALAASQRAAALDPRLEPGVEHLAAALSSAEEAKRSLRSYRDDGIDSDPARLEEIEERLETIRSLKRKYGETIEEIVAYGDSLGGKLNDLQNSDERESELQRSLDRTAAELSETSSRLSRARTAGGELFALSILAELHDLGMPQSRFEVVIEESPISARGADRVEFSISPNPGEPLKQLAKIASGGELSRVMLALKTVLSRSAYVPTLIFDEIDIGIGGRTALTIADKLASLARGAQVFCITHLPQIASQPAAAHFAIEKQMAGERTVVTIRSLDYEGRVEEIARMLGGSKGSETVVRHAREMLGGAIPSR